MPRMARNDGQEAGKLQLLGMRLYVRGLSCAKDAAKRR
jgi:hypothetical protein